MERIGKCYKGYKDKKEFKKLLQEIIEEELAKAFILYSPAIVQGVTDAIRDSSEVVSPK